MDKQEYLKIVRKEIKYIFDRNKIEEELSCHIEDSIDEFMSEGYSYEDAMIEALNQMGDPKEIGKLLNKQHHPLMSYLYKLSLIILPILVVMIIFNLLMWGLNVTTLMFPHKTDDYVQLIKLDYKVELAGHTFILDNVCINENDEATLNYRTFNKLAYSRSGWSVHISSLLDIDGNYIDYSSRSASGFIGRSCYINFSLPSNEVFQVTMPDDQIVIIDLEEYRNE